MEKINFDYIKGNNRIKIIFKILVTLIVVYLSNYYLQLSQNNWDFNLAQKFAMEWHTEKFLIGCLVLLILDVFLISLVASFGVGNLIYSLIIVVVGIVNAQKMSLRMEPFYPEDLKMMFEFTMLKDIVGNFFFFLGIIVMIAILFLLGWFIYKSRSLTRRTQIIRISFLCFSFLGLLYINNFNSPENKIRKAYDRTALWIPYSQKMNYYNVGFVGGYLYNLKVEPMEKPEQYSQETVLDIVERYSKLADQDNAAIDNGSDYDQPNIVFVMSESFSDPNRLEGITLNKNPIQTYQNIAEQSFYQGNMLSSGYGGGTANIEFEALTGISLEVLNPQMTTPYTMLFSGRKEFPSIVSTLKQSGYNATAIHPYNTSMYKRKDVYKVLGFDTFLSESTMAHTEKKSESGYISDESALKEVLSVLENNTSPSFVHLVTMQTHMPYNTKYSDSEYISLSENPDSNLSNYAQDLEYSSEALQFFIDEINQLEQRTIVVFWGDHLPSIYSDDILNQNEWYDPHLTEYLIYDTKNQQNSQINLNPVTSPVYFQSLVSQLPNIKMSGYDALLLELSNIIPAFENDMYLYSGEWHHDLSLNADQKKIMEDYQMIVYDIVSGNGYTPNRFFDK